MHVTQSVMCACVHKQTHRGTHASDAGADRKEWRAVIEALLADSGEVAIRTNQHLGTDRRLPPVKVKGDSVVLLIILSHLYRGRTDALFMCLAK